jgi:hypothetical protein
MTTDNAPVCATTLPTTGTPTPAAAWIKTEKLRAVYMPAAAALTLLIATMGAGGALLVAAIVDRVMS